MEKQLEALMEMMKELKKDNADIRKELETLRPQSKGKEEETPTTTPTPVVGEKEAPKKTAVKKLKTIRRYSSVDFPKPKGQADASSSSSKDTAEKPASPLEEQIFYEETEEEESDEREAVKKAICGKPKFFTGKSPREVGQATKWLTTLERYLEAQNLKDEESKILVASTYLEEDASEWFESLKHAIKSFSGFKKVFLASYEAVNVQETALINFHNLKQGTMTVEEYLSKFNSLVTWLPHMSVEMKTEKFVCGLRPQIRDHIFENKLAGDFCEAVSAALRKDQYASARGGMGMQGLNTVRGMGGGNYQRKEGCWNCGLPGHTRKDCRRKPQSKPQEKPQDKKPWEKRQLALMDNTAEATGAPEEEQGN